jgi:16S rRNA (cytosine1402-N4)-methyltransferase
VLPHTPVLLDEVLAALNIQPAGRYLDATLGRAGHTRGILQRLDGEGRVLGIDRDPEAIRATSASVNDSRLTIFHGAFSQLETLVSQAGFDSGFDGILLDLGVSSPQLDEAARGFSFMQDGPLDMRMNYDTGPTAATWLARAPESELLRVLREFGEEKFARRIASAIVAARHEAPITRTGQLAEIVANAVPVREPGKHPATRTFQALRIQINSEFDELQAGLKAALNLLAAQGRLCVISFHSLEDGITKRFMQQHSLEDPIYAGLPNVPPHARAKLRRIGRAIHPTQAEVDGNPRSRSAILRVAERLAA